MTAIILSLLASVSWGTGDFLGGMVARRVATFVAVAISLTVGGGLLAVVLLVVGADVHGGTWGWGALAGAFGGFGLVLFYRALAIGTMSVVAPISGCSALVPAAIDMARGNVPGVLVLIGIVSAIVGVVLASAEPAHDGAKRSGSRGVLLAIGAAIGFGLFLVLIERAVVEGDSFASLWAVVAARSGSVVTLVPIAIWMVFRDRTRLPTRGIASVIVIIALFDTTANALYAISTLYGQLAVVGVLASMYPVTTVALATFALRERIAAHQWVGVAFALTGISLVSVG